MPTYLRFVCFCAVLLAWPSCDINRDPLIIFKAGDQFRVDMQEVLTPNARSFVLNIETVEVYDCANHYFVYDLRSDGSGSITLRLEGVMAPLQCEGDPAPARVAIPLGILAVGDYALRIELSDAVVNTGTLRVAEEFYDISMNSSAGLQFLNTRLLRVPEGSIWGVVGGLGAGDGFLAEPLEQALLAIGAEAKLLPVGDYGHFRISPQLALLLPSESQIPAPNRSTFIYHYTGNLAELNSTAHQFRIDHPEAQLRLFTWRGEEL